MPVRVTLTNASSSRYRGQAEIVASIEKTLKREGVKTARVDVVLVDDKEMKKLNSRFLKHNRTTDVITFPLEVDPMYGEIYISLEAARRQAIEYGVGVINELSRLAVHGTLHLVGYDDSTEEQANIMHRLEDKYITSL
ncbi:MAG: rRNA maturation RNase YbeY [bacterium]|nr:rRNA maturation RNase YbeY [bacterium]